VTIYSTDKAADTATENSNPGQLCCCEELKQSIDTRLRRPAAALDKTAAEH